MLGEEKKYVALAFIVKALMTLDYLELKIADEWVEEGLQSSQVPPMSPFNQHRQDCCRLFNQCRTAPPTDTDVYGKTEAKGNGARGAVLVA